MRGLRAPDWRRDLTFGSVSAMNAIANDFERELDLQDLLRGIDTQRLATVLQELTGVPIAVLDRCGDCLLGSPPASPDCPSQPVVVELEPVGRLFAQLPPEQLQAATALLTQLLRCNTRYLLASDLHLQTQQADFAELQCRNAALQQSEQRYKALSEQLEQRVQQQVKSLENAQLKLYESEKLAAVGRLAAGIAHEINNPIGFIRSNLCTAREYLSSLHKIAALIATGADTQVLQTTWKQEDMDFVQQDIQDILSESIDGAERIAAIVKDLKGFSRINEAERENTDINLIIHQTCHVAAAELRDKAELELDLGNLPLLYCHPGELGQAFLSLLLNAVDALTPVGKIRFRTYADDQRIHIEVRDNGCGIPESEMANVFDPFFTTKDVGKGMGLGLTVCRNIVQAHQGDIRINSKPQAGTLVSIRLPMTTSPSG